MSSSICDLLSASQGRGQASVERSLASSRQLGVTWSRPSLHAKQMKD